MAITLVPGHDELFIMNVKLIGLIYFIKSLLRIAEFIFSTSRHITQGQPNPVRKVAMRTKFCPVAPNFLGGPEYGNYFMSLLRHLEFWCGSCNFAKFHASLNLIVLIHLMKDCKR